MYDLDAMLSDLVTRGAFDLHLKARTPVYVRVLDQLEPTAHPVPTVADMDSIAARILSPVQFASLEHNLQTDTVYEMRERGLRFRASVYRQRGTLGVSLRHIPPYPPTLQELGLPPAVVNELLAGTRGIILITGPAASGKTTTVASLLTAFNQRLDAHIVTLEDPVEYVFESSRSVITQRQVGSDTPSFAAGLRQVLRQDPDIIFVGELRDCETITIALSAAETGRLVVSTLHTPTVAATIEELIGIFPVQQQEQVRFRLSLNLKAVLSQVLVTAPDRYRRIAAFEALLPTDPIRNLIRQNQTFRIGETLETSAGSCSLRRSLAELVKQGRVGLDDARRHLASL